MSFAFPQTLHSGRRVVRVLALAVAFAATAVLLAAPSAFAKTKAFSMSLSGTFDRSTTGTATDVQPACTQSDVADEHATYTFTAAKKGGTFKLPQSVQFDFAHANVAAVGTYSHKTSYAITDPNSPSPCIGAPQAVSENCGSPSTSVDVSFSIVAGSTLTLQTPSSGANDLLGTDCPTLAARSSFQFVSDPVKKKVTALDRLKRKKSLSIPFVLDKTLADGSGIKTVLKLRLTLKATRVS